jgi:hypothetical protein
LCFGFFFAFLLTNGEILNYLVLPLKFKSEVGNHLNGFDLMNILKYIMYSGPIPFVLLFVIKKSLIKHEIALLILVTLLLSFFGRSYYVVYFYVVILFIIVNKNEIIRINNKSFTSLMQPSIFYSLLILILIPCVLILIAPKTNTNWRNVIEKIALEKSKWQDDIKYFVPAQLTLEVADMPNARLLYSFMIHNDGIQRVEDRVFYITSKDQIQIIKKSFHIKDKKLILIELIPESEGHIIMTSLLKKQIKKADKSGLWKVKFVD